MGMGALVLTDCTSHSSLSSDGSGLAAGAIGGRGKLARVGMAMDGVEVKFVSRSEMGALNSVAQ